MSFEQTLPINNEPVQPLMRERHFVFGHFKSNATVHDAGRLVAQSIRNQHETLSLSFFLEDTAHHPFTTRTPMKYRRSVDLIDRLLGEDTAKITIFLDDFFDAPFQRTDAPCASV